MNRKHNKYLPAVAATSVLILVVVLLIIIAFITVSCDKGLTIIQDYDYEVVNMPYKQTNIEMNIPIEIRVQIQSAFSEGTQQGTFIPNKYTMRYFPFSGNGILEHQDGTVYLPNDIYSIQERTFRLYYTPTSGTDHNLTLYFNDDFNRQHEFQIQCSVNDTLIY